MGSEQPPGRFAHLLRPIRDLSKVWNIEIADELERYIEEVSQLVVTNPEDGLTQLNFAEAALLIQGSCAVYSRKVELLYQLVYQALLSIDKTKEGAQGKRGKGGVHSGLWAPIPDTEELLTIDHLIKEGRNIYLDPGACEQRQVSLRRVPLFLMPRDQADRRKKEFRISSCHVHDSGAYLLQESDAALLDRLLSEGGCLEDDSAGAPLVPAPPREVQDLDDRLQELLRELPPAVGDDPQASPVPDMDPGYALAPPTPIGGCTTPVPQLEDPPPLGFAPAPVPGVPAKVVARAAGPDPWALLDEHAPGDIKDAPLEVGKTCRRLNEKKLLLSADGLPDLGLGEVLSDDALWSEPSAESAAPLLLAGHPVESLFLAVAGRLKTGGRFEVQRAGFSGAWLEFEDLFVAARAKRRRVSKAGSRGQPGAGAPATPLGQGYGGDVSDDEAGLPPPHVPGDVMSTPLRGDACGAPGMPFDDAFEEKRQQVAELENMIQDAQHKYEATIRQHLHSTHKDSVDADSRRFPQLYANVRRWQEQLEPVLKEFARRPEFDISSYSTKFVSKMQALKSGDAGEGEAIPFSQLVQGQPRWEVCRQFLTCLLLTNQGNTDIVFDGEEERMNSFGVKLLKADVAAAALDGEEAAACAPVARKGAARRRGSSKVVEAGAKAFAADEAERPRKRPWQEAGA